MGRLSERDIAKETDDLEITPGDLEWLEWYRDDEHRNQNTGRDNEATDERKS